MPFVSPATAHTRCLTSAAIAPSAAKQAAAQQPTKEPVSWNALTKEETSTPAAPQKKLSDKVETILNEAGTALRKSLFKSDTDGAPDAAE